MTVYVQPPVVGGADTYTIISNPSATEQATLKSEGYPSFATQAEAEAFVKARNGSFTLATNPVSAAIQAVSGNDTAAGQSKGVLGNITGGFLWPDAKNFVVRALKVVLGGLLVVVGLVHMTGIDNKAAQLVRKVPLPV